MLECPVPHVNSEGFIEKLEYIRHVVDVSNTLTGATGRFRFKKVTTSTNVVTIICGFFENVVHDGIISKPARLATIRNTLPHHGQSQSNLPQDEHRAHHGHTPKTIVP
mgnify:CR=1 FL=1